jgi:hypothetical protein
MEPAGRANARPMAQSGFRKVRISLRSINVIASVSEAIHWASGKEWMASSQRLLAMTWMQFRDLAARCARGVLENALPS